MIIDNISLRRLQPKDCTEEYLSWVTDESNRRFITTLKTINTISDLKNSTIPRLSNPLISIVGIFYNQKHIGNIQARTISTNECVISILIGAKELRGKGIAKHAINQFLNTSAFLPICSQLITFYAVIDEKNTASQNLFLSTGFKRQNFSTWPEQIEKDKNNTLLFSMRKQYNDLG
tara:strand:+ start:12743 stop:13270 length:528 start_codon:yes stop_codon:yes gene_type:complete